MEYDFRIENHGSVFLLTPLNDNAQAWADLNLQEVVKLGKSIAVEPRYVDNILYAIENDGFTVETN